MASQQTLEGFLSRIRDHGLALASHYVVSISDPESSEVTMMVDSVTMPGMSIMTNEMRTFGEIITMPYGITYNPVTLSVIVDNTGDAMRYFHDWSNKVFDRDSRFVGYRREYARTVTILLEDRADGKIYSLYLEDAWPINISDISLDYSSHDVVRLSVSLMYTRWTVFEPSITDSELKDATDAIGDRITAMRMQSTIDRDTRLAARDFGNPDNIGSEFQSYGGEMGASIGRATSAGQAALKNRTLIGANGADQAGALSSSLGNLTSNFVKMGEGIRDLGRNLNDVVAPVRAISGAVASVSTTLGSIDSTLSALGMGTPFSKIRTQLNTTGGLLYNVSTLKGVPRHLGTIGANMTGMGNTFGAISKSIETSTNATKQISGSLNKIGSTFERQGMNVNNGAGNLDKYADNNP